MSAQLVWRRGSHDDSRTAGKLFSELCGRGYHAFAVSGGHCARRIDTFSPALCEVILTPGPAQGWEDCDLQAWEASVADARSWLGSIAEFITGRKSASRGTAPLEQRTLRGKRQALCMLLAMLDAMQRRGLRNAASFHLLGGASGALYRLRAESPAEIDQLDHGGRTKYRLRIAAACRLPLHTALLVHALYLQDPESEHAYLSGADILANNH